MRLQKYLAHCGVTSRRKAENLIVRGHVKVNGTVVSELGVIVDPQRDMVEVRGRTLKQEIKGIILLNKPRHVVCTRDDPQGRPTVMDYLSSRYKSYYPVGRLDFESEGLVIMTNDGELADMLLHPRYGFERTYEIDVAGSVSGRDCARIERGVRLEDGVVSAKAQIFGTRDGITSMSLRIGVGRNRVIRRMMLQLGFPVQSLKRVSHGPFGLGRLKPGEIRQFAETEFQRMRAKIFKIVESRMQKEAL